MGKQEIARQAAEGLRASLHARRQADANRIGFLCTLAEAYEVEFDEVVEALASQLTTIGGAGTPLVSEFIGLELGPLLGCSEQAANGQLADALDLKHRHRPLYDAVQALEVDAHRALAVAHRCHGLCEESAAEVSRRWLRLQHRLTFSGSLRLAEQLIIEVDAEAAARAEAKAREGRGVWLWPAQDGVSALSGKLDSLDGLYFDAQLDRMAELLGEAHPDLDRDQLRAKAVGALAHPAYALRLLQGAAQPALIDEASPHETRLLPTDGTSVPADNRPPAGAEPTPEADKEQDVPVCHGELCGTITVDPADLRPQVDVVVHIHSDAVGTLTGAARIERAGHITTALLTELLGEGIGGEGVGIAVRPVIDLPELPPQDGYRPSPRMREAVRLAFPTEMFPFSDRDSRSLDIDHTVTFEHGAHWTKGQTRIGNLFPVRRRPHRAKTAGSWKLYQPSPGVAYWISPLGYRYWVTHWGTESENGP